ncbi:MAG: AAA family ATPase [Candidatus Glassbacteria bacterium]
MYPRLTSLTIKNYKSINSARITLEPLTVLVGPNGAGKSNCVDALAFIQQSLSGSVELAFKKRGGIGAVRRKSLGHPTNIFLSLTLLLNENLKAYYAFAISAKTNKHFNIAKEVCIVYDTKRNIKHIYGIKNGEFRIPIPGVRAQIFPDRLGLIIASATEEFRPVFDFLSSMRFYSIEPNKIRELQEPDMGYYLNKDGSNASAILKKIIDSDTGNVLYEKICNLLAIISTGISSVEYNSTGHKETLTFKQDVGAKYPWKFDALNMSDGTLRALGLLLAVYQQGYNPLIAIEEPEATVNPAVAETVFQILSDASKFRQILITTHSPDVLDQKDLREEQIKVVTMDRGKTIVSNISEANRQAIKEKLYTPGELLRIGELNPPD